MLTIKLKTHIILLRARVPSQKNTRMWKMHSPQPVCYDHVTREIYPVCQTVKRICEYTRPLQNAKVMAREKHGKAAEKVMFIGKESIEEQFILSNLAIAVALALLTFI